MGVVGLLSTIAASSPQAISTGPQNMAVLQALEEESSAGEV